MTHPDDINQVWSAAIDTLVQSGRLAGADFGYTRLVSPRGFLGDTALLAVASAYTKEHLETNLLERLTDALSQVAGRPVNFAVTVDPSLPQPDSPPPAAGLESAPAAPTPLALIGVSGRRPAPVAHRAPTQSRLQDRYTFESFVVGRTNRFAAAAARAVAEAPATAYNPLFIFGKSGLGKTHLLHAIGNYALALSDSLRVLYTTSEDFVNHFISCVSEKDMDEFKRFYRSTDILLIDDIQFLIKKDASTEEFFHTFNSLHNSGSQIVITSDTPPKQLVGFEDRLRSRFEWGLLADVLPPPLETRIAILRKKCLREGMDVPDDVQEFIASRISSNIRELEGALIRVTAFANLNQQAVDLPLAEIVLRDLVTNSEAEITPSLIIGQTAKYFSLTIEDLRGPSRRRNLTDVRHIAMYLCRELTDLSLPAIGREFGGRDHTTVLSAYRKIAPTLSQEPSLFAQVSELTYRIKQSAAEA
ncbi:MAG: chromosomal replication initiator protein DnaA [Bifidobacteriaceae bacterium]|nr:chromosomal replication initiator protein DnaA [Bifidobacteriaceae bacterium]